MNSQPRGGGGQDGRRCGLLPHYFVNLFSFITVVYFNFVHLRISVLEFVGHGVAVANS